MTAGASYTGLFVRTYCLSLHASYGCRHSGACCSAWTVPAEPHVIAIVRDRKLRPSGGGPVFIPEARGSGPPHIAHGVDGGCVFRERRRCTIHREAGEMALPVSCRHYPRVVLRDPRGTLVSFSHYCPTAAALLFQDEPVRTVAAGSSVSIREPVEGLDARGALPPLIHPGMLADLDGYDAWERTVIDTLMCAPHLSRALDVIASATEEVRRWTPADGALTKTVTAAFTAASESTIRGAWSSAALDIVGTLNRGEVTLDKHQDLEIAWQRLAPPERVDLHRPVANYLAARAFANWVAYQGHGLRTVVAWLRACHDVLRSVALSRAASTLRPLAPVDLLESIRVTDMVMLHTIDSHAFSRAAAVFEKRPAA